MSEAGNVVPIRGAEEDRPGCPDCGGHDLETSLQVQEFPHGVGADAITLRAEVPARRCRACGSEFTDDEAESLRHEAVCRHLSVMTPREVESVRKRHRMSRAEFARLTRLGEASLARWESGVLIQNPANDALLALLAYPDNVDRLRARAEGPRAEGDVLDGRYKFRALRDVEKKRAEGAQFRLRRG